MRKLKDIRANPTNFYIVIVYKLRKKYVLNEVATINFCNDYFKTNFIMIEEAYKFLKATKEAGIFRVFKEKPVWYAIHKKPTPQERKEFYFKGWLPPTHSIWYKNAISKEEISQKEMNIRLNKGVVRIEQIGTIDECY